MSDDRDRGVQAQLLAFIREKFNNDPTFLDGLRGTMEKMQTGEVSGVDLPLPSINEPKVLHPDRNAKAHYRLDAKPGQYVISGLPVDPPGIDVYDEPTDAEKKDPDVIHLDGIYDPKSTRTPEELLEASEKIAQISEEQLERQQRIANILDGWATILPKRVVNEELGDYLEDISKRIAAGQTWKPRLRLLSAIFWTGINAIGYTVKDLLGRRQAS